MREGKGVVRGVGEGQYASFLKISTFMLDLKIIFEMSGGFNTLKGVRSLLRGLKLFKLIHSHFLNFFLYAALENTLYLN